MMIDAKLIAEALTAASDLESGDPDLLPSDWYVCDLLRRIAAASKDHHTTKNTTADK